MKLICEGTMLAIVPWAYLHCSFQNCIMPYSTTVSYTHLVKDSGGFDILVSTVGVNCHCPAAEYKDEDMFRLLETNYLSGVRCARKVIPTMQARGGGSIINISSIHSLMSQPTNMLYACLLYTSRCV